MFEYEVIEEIKPSTEILEIIKNCTFTIKRYGYRKQIEISNMYERQLQSY